MATHKKYPDELRERAVKMAGTIITVRSLIRQAWPLYRWDGRPAGRP